MNAIHSSRPQRALGVLRLTALAAAVLGLSACSTINEIASGDKVDYKASGSKTAPALDIPPDLSQLSRDARFNVPGGAITASGFQAGQASAAQSGVATAATAMGDVRVERAGNQRWLVVKRPPEKLWDPVREFWQENGFLLNVEDQKLGIMETDFAENRAKIPQDFIRRSIGRVLDGLYSTGEQDKFRTRLERTASGETEIYISHRGMVETVTGGSSVGSTSTVWQPRPADPELEAEFLRRLMVRLGVSQEQARAAAPAAAPSVARVSTSSGQPTVQIDEGFDRAWRRVGLSLDRTGFTVEDRDRAQGLYFVRYVNPATDQKDKGLFGRLIGGKSSPAAPQKYRVAVRSTGNTTTVSVLDANGQPDSSANAKRIVQVIADDLK